MAAIHIEPTVMSHSWDVAQYEPMLRLKEKYDLIYEFTEGVTVPEGERVGRSYAERGFDIIMFTSWYPDAIKAIARDYPDIVVLGAGGGTELHVLYPPPEEIPPNVGHYDSYLHESAYLCGYLAGKMTETNIIGIVGQYPVLNANRYFNGFIQGVYDAFGGIPWGERRNPNVDVKITWIFTWYDPPKGREAAISLIEAGADIIFSDAAGASTGAAEKGVYFIASQLERPDIDWAPEVVLASSNWILDPIFEEIIVSVMEDRFEAKEYYAGMAGGGAKFKINLPEAVPPGVVDELKVLEERILNGELVIQPIITQPEAHWGL